MFDNQGQGQCLQVGGSGLKPRAAVETIEVEGITTIELVDFNLNVNI